MWVLRELSSNEIWFSLSAQSRTYSVGRQKSDIILSNDTSISREHCIINISEGKECPFPCSTQHGVWIVDNESKYGTYVKNGKEWTRIKRKEVFQIKNKDVVRFGLMQSIFSFEMRPFIITSSMVSNDVKQQIKLNIKALEGELINNWSNTSSPMIVVVSELTLTFKVVCALINGIPIVTPNFLNELKHCHQQKLKWPDYDDYKPKIIETSIKPEKVSLSHKQNRKELFKNFKFYFILEKQQNDLKFVIESAGGNTYSLTSDIDNDILLEDKTIVIQPPASNELFSFVSGMLMKHKRRTVPDCEIAQAIAYASTEIYCNPAFLQFNIRKNRLAVPEKNSLVVDDTPTLTTNELGGCSKFNQVVPSTPSQAGLSQVNEKIKENFKKRAPELTENSPCKRRAVENTTNKQTITSSRIVSVAVDEEEKEIKLELSNFQTKEKKKDCTFWSVSNTKDNTTDKCKRKLIVNNDNIENNDEVKRKYICDETISLVDDGYINTSKIKNKTIKLEDEIDIIVPMLKMFVDGEKLKNVKPFRKKKLFTLDSTEMIKSENMYIDDGANKSCQITKPTLRTVTNKNVGNPFNLL